MSEPNSGKGRRGDAVEDASRMRVVTSSSPQNRHVRRNNLRIARIEARRVAKAEAAKADGLAL